MFNEPEFKRWYVLKFLLWNVEKYSPLENFLEVTV
jgi:hypothetical protein